jgi:putative ATP-binding cassette transporter
LLLLAAVLYAALGSLLTVLLGRRLMTLNVVRLWQEADLRRTLIHLRDNAEPIVLLRVEGPDRGRVLGRLNALMENLKAIIGANRTLGCFTVGYNYLIPVIPGLIMAPLFIAGKVELRTVERAIVRFVQHLQQLAAAQARPVPLVISRPGSGTPACS